MYIYVCDRMSLYGIYTMCIVCRCPQRPGASDPLELQAAVNCLMEVLGAEPRSSLCKSSMWSYLLSHLSNL